MDNENSINLNSFANRKNKAKSFESKLFFGMEKPNTGLNTRVSVDEKKEQVIQNESIIKNIIDNSNYKDSINGPANNKEDLFECLNKEEKTKAIKNEGFNIKNYLKTFLSKNNKNELENMNHRVNDVMRPSKIYNKSKSLKDTFSNSHSNFNKKTNLNLATYNSLKDNIQNNKENNNEKNMKIQKIIKRKVKSARRFSQFHGDNVSHQEMNKIDSFQNFNKVIKDSNLKFINGSELPREDNSNINKNNNLINLFQKVNTVLKGNRKSVDYFSKSGPFENTLHNLILNSKEGSKKNGIKSIIDNNYISSNTYQNNQRTSLKSNKNENVYYNNNNNDSFHPNIILNKINKSTLPFEQNEEIIIKNLKNAKRRLSCKPILDNLRSRKYVDYTTPSQLKNNFNLISKFSQQNVNNNYNHGNLIEMIKNTKDSPNNNKRFDKEKEFLNSEVLNKHKRSSQSSEHLIDSDISKFKDKYNKKLKENDLKEFEDIKEDNYNSNNFDNKVENKLDEDEDYKEIKLDDTLNELEPNLSDISVNLEKHSENRNFTYISTFKLNDRELARRCKVYDSLSDEEIEADFDFLIHPDARIKEFWDFLILFITLYTITFVPYNMAYLDIGSLSLIFFDMFCDIVYIIDLILQFFIPIQEYDETYITSFKKIFFNYMSSWFLLDLLSSLPINSVLSVVLYIDQAIISSGDTINSVKVSKNLSNVAKLMRMYRLIKLMKLLRLLKLIKISKKQYSKNKPKLKIIEDLNISSTLKRLLIFLFYFVLLNHVLACVWTFIGSLDNPNWIVNHDMQDSSNLDLYITSLYFNIYTIFTIGYGNICSISTAERIYNIIIMLVGIMLYSFAVSSLANIIQQVDEKTSKFKKNLNYLEESKIRYNIPQSIFSKIKRFLTYEYQVNRLNKNFLLEDLPQVIRSELICEMYAEIIKNFIFFKNTNTEFCAKVIMSLSPTKALRGDVIIFEDEFLEELIFVKRGVLALEKKYRGHSIKLFELRRNEHFGEIFMLLNEKCQYSVICKSKICEMFLMKKIDLIDICTEFHDIFEAISNKSTYNMLIVERKYINLKTEIDKNSTRIDSELNDENIYVTEKSETSSEGLSNNKGENNNKCDSKSENSKHSSWSDSSEKSKKSKKENKDEGFILSGGKTTKILSQFDVIIESDHEEYNSNSSDNSSSNGSCKSSNNGSNKSSDQRSKIKKYSCKSIDPIKKYNLNKFNSVIEINPLFDKSSLTLYENIEKVKSLKKSSNSLKDYFLITPTQKDSSINIQTPKSKTSCKSFDQSSDLDNSDLNSETSQISRTLANKKDYLSQNSSKRSSSDNVINLTDTNKKSSSLFKNISNEMENSKNSITQITEPLKNNLFPIERNNQNQNFLCNVNKNQSISRIKRDSNLRRNTNLISNAIHDNIRKGSQNMNNPKKFYNDIFSKWKIDDQNKRLKALYNKLKDKYSL